MYFDSHAHLDDAHFDGDRAAILTISKTTA